MVHPVHPVTTETTSLTVVLGLVKSVRKKRHSAQMIDRAAKVSTTMSLINAGAQWLSGRVLDSRPRGRGSSLTSVTALWSLSKTHYPSLELVQPRKTHPCLTERLLMGHKESNQTNKKLINAQKIGH